MFNSTRVFIITVNFVAVTMCYVFSVNECSHNENSECFRYDVVKRDFVLSSIPRVFRPLRLNMKNNSVISAPFIIFRRYIFSLERSYRTQILFL